MNVRIQLSLILLFLSLISCSNSIKTENIKNSYDNSTSNNPIFQEFYPNGKVKIEGVLMDNKRHGIWTSYYENGQKWSETNYQMGVKNGKTISYYTNGNTRFIGSYKEDEKSDVWFFYNENGTFEKEVNFAP